MMNINLTVTFTDPDGTTRDETHQVEASESPTEGGEQRLAHNLFADMSVAVGKQAAPKHNAAARAWLKYPGKGAGLHEYFDVQNSRALWLELSNLVIGAEYDLISAQAYKNLEPNTEPDAEDQPAMNNLYYIHDRKVSLLNQAVYALIKVQDLVNRLLHESLGGDLVDSSKSDWERSQLTRLNVLKGLQRKSNEGRLSPTDFQEIGEALKIPTTMAKSEIAKGYRNKLMHHVRPSVDYVMFYSTLEARAGEEIIDANGKVIGRKYAIKAKPPLDYVFADLHAAFSEYLDAIASMLERLSRIEILRR
jgi:hypothetical protein